MYGIEYLKNKLAQKKCRINLRYDFYDMKHKAEYLSKLLPAEYKWLGYSLGWCASAVDNVADRLAVYGVNGDELGIYDIYKNNNADVLFDSAILSALITSCSFLYISEKDGEPVITVIDGGHATGIVDEATAMLKEGYAVLEYDEDNNPILEAYFEPFSTTYYRNDGTVTKFTHASPYPLLVPVIYRPDAKRPFGRSRISRACMSIQDGAVRTLTRSEVASEFYAFPQKYILGMESDAEFNNRAATMSSFLRIDKDDDGDKPSVGQFTAASIQPYVETLRAYASMFAGETGLTLDDLGFASQNPSSAEAIKASHDRLRLTANKAQRSFGTAFVNAGYLASCLRDEVGYNRTIIRDASILWEPTFTPDSTMISSIGDGLLKITQAYPGYITDETMRQLTGIKKYD